MPNSIRLFEVGGSIRDELMGIADIPDRDFCAEAPSWEALESWCFEKMKKVFLVTPEFFTIRGMMPNGTAIDVVMCRKDGPSSDGRHPDHVEPGTLLDDLARRDFTVNAMAREVDPETLEPIGKIIDPFDGRHDILTRSLRCVGEPSERFREDGLRILRAARFAFTKQLGWSHTLSEEIKNPVWWTFAGSTVSKERIREELAKMFKHDSLGAMVFIVNELPFEARTMISSSGIWFKPTMEKK